MDVDQLMILGYILLTGITAAFMWSHTTTDAGDPKNIIRFCLSILVGIFWPLTICLGILMYLTEY